MSAMLDVPMDDLPREVFRVRFIDLLLAQSESTFTACHGLTRAQRAERAQRKVNAFSLMQLIERWRARAKMARSNGQTKVAEAIDAYAEQLRIGESAYDFEHECVGDAATIQACIDALVACDTERFALFLFNGEGAVSSRHVRFLADEI